MTIGKCLPVPDSSTGVALFVPAAPPVPEQIAGPSMQERREVPALCLRAR
jgi:hypothetical protein